MPTDLDAWRYDYGLAADGQLIALEHGADSVHGMALYIAILAEAPVENSRQPPPNDWLIGTKGKKLNGCRPSDRSGEILTQAPRADRLG